MEGQRELEVTAPDGRRLHLFDAGVPDGPLVVVHHGTPMSGILEPSAVRSATARRIRLVGYDRPGYGGSDRDPGRSVASVAADTAAIADALGADRFATWGLSAGGPHALACAALLPARVVAAASVAGVAPWSADGLDWLAGMGPENVEEFTAARAGEDTLRDFLEPARDELLAADPVTLREALGGLLSDVDRSAVTGELATYLLRAMVSGQRPGVEGWLDDDLAFTRDWGFSVGDISVPVLVVQGEQDRMVPPAHGGWLAAHVRGAHTLLSPEDGHLTLMTGIDRVHDWLLQR